MSLTENTLFGTIDREKVAIERLITFEPSEGYWVADSGGKDSEVIVDLVRRSGVRADYHHSLTTVDAPQTIWHIRKHHPFTKIEHPETPLLQRMLKKGIPPLRQKRWCCSEYKERGGNSRFVVTGIRAAESSKRAKRKMVETCYRDSTKIYLNVIIDWSDADVWQYIKENNLPVNPLYKEPYNFERVGCVLCPMVRDIERQFLYFPKLCEAWHRAIIRLYYQQIGKGKNTLQSSAEEYWQWWLNRDAQIPNPDQTTLFE